jgi:hypothetical protein
MDNYDRDRQEYYDRKMRKNEKLLRLYFLACTLATVIAILMYVFDL